MHALRLEDSIADVDLPARDEAALSLAAGVYASRIGYRRALLAAAVLMASTGVAFALIQSWWPLLVVAFAGTLNPSSGVPYGPEPDLDKVRELCVAPGLIGMPAAPLMHGTGMFTSLMTTSGECARTAASAATPSIAVTKS